MNNSFYIRENILILTVSLPVIIGAFRYKILDKGARIFYCQCIFALAVEVLAYYLATYRHQNLLVYNISCIIELCIVALYFNYTIESFRKRNVGYIITCFSLLIGIINIFFIQSLYGITHYYLTYQALVTIGMSVISLHSSQIRGDKHGKKNEAHFWLPVILMFNWSLLYLLFTLINYFDIRSRTLPHADTHSLLLSMMFLSIVSYLTNMSVATVFYYYPKMNTHVR